MRARLWEVAGVVMCALALAAGVMWGWVAWTGRQSATIDVPAASAPPMEVAKAYVAAVNAHDCTTAKKLSTPGGADTAAMWCDDVRSLAVATWGTPFLETPRWSGHHAPQEVVFVPATIRVTWRPFHDDGSFSPSAVHTWGYVLVRENPTAPWRVADQGPV